MFRHEFANPIQLSITQGIYTQSRPAKEKSSRAETYGRKAVGAHHGGLAQRRRLEDRRMGLALHKVDVLLHNHAGALANVHIGDRDALVDSDGDVLEAAAVLVLEDVCLQSLTEGDGVHEGAVVRDADAIHLAAQIAVGAGAVLDDVQLALLLMRTSCDKRCAYSVESSNRGELNRMILSLALKQ